jgi:hypothetical protein
MQKERNGAATMTDLKELKAWIEKNNKHFTEEKYSIEDIARLAVTCGFNRITVAQWQTSAKFHQAAH